MSLDALRASANERFMHVRSLLALVRVREAEEGLAPTDETRMLRGLWFVHLYAALEHAVTGLVQESLRQIAATNPKLNELQTRFHAVSLNGLFQSLGDSKGKRLRKRLDILDSQASDSLCVLNDTLFADLLQNVKTEVLVDICDCMCLSVECLTEDPVRRYIDEIVDRRNAVAHGRESAVEVGSRINAANLEIRLHANQRFVDQFADALDLLLTEKRFLRERQAG